MPQDPTPLMDLVEVAERLGVNQRHVRRLVAERRIAFHNVGHFLRFRADDLDAFLEAGRVEPAPARPRPGSWSTPVTSSGRGGGRR